MKRKILITGGKGMLASALEAFYTCRGDTVSAPVHAKLDVLNHSIVRQAIEAFRPDYVFHTAALHVDACEEDPELAFRLNAWASAHLARLCEQYDAAFIYISSCGYFGDDIRYYSEYDPVMLKTIYARSKHQGETLALRECRRTFAIRPGWLFGGSIHHKKNFVYQRYLEALKSPLLKSAVDKFGCPTYVDDFTVKIDEIIQTNMPGLYHVTNSGGCNRFEYTRKIIAAAKLRTEVIPVDSKSFPRKAQVPDCELLCNWNIKFLGISPLPSWEEAVERYVQVMLKEANA